MFVFCSRSRFFVRVELRVFFYYAKVSMGAPTIYESRFFSDFFIFGSISVSVSVSVSFRFGLSSSSLLFI